MELNGGVILVHGSLHPYEREWVSSSVEPIEQRQCIGCFISMLVAGIFYAGTVQFVLLTNSVSVSDLHAVMQVVFLHCYQTDRLDHTHASPHVCPILLYVDDFQKVLKRAHDYGVEKVDHLMTEPNY